MWLIIQYVYSENLIRNELIYVLKLYLRIDYDL